MIYASGARPKGGTPPTPAYWGHPDPGLLGSEKTQVSGLRHPQ